MILNFIKGAVCVQEVRCLCKYWSRTGTAVVQITDITLPDLMLYVVTHTDQLVTVTVSV